MRRNLLLLLGALFVAGIVAYLVQDIVRAVILIPLLYLWQIGVIVIGLCPQSLYWITFLLVLLAIALSNLARIRNPFPQSQDEPVERGSPIANWHRWIRNLPRGSYYKAGFAQSTGRLVLEILALREQLTYEQAKERLIENQLDVPADIREFVLAGFDPRGYLYSKPTQVSGSITSSRKRREDTPLDLPVERLLQFLEMKMTEMEEKR